MIDPKPKNAAELRAYFSKLPDKYKQIGIVKQDKTKLDVRGPAQKIDQNNKAVNYYLNSGKEDEKKPSFWYYVILAVVAYILFKK